MCFLPGQKVHMSMIFRWQKRRTDVCPICKAGTEKKRGIDLVCSACGVFFERVLEVENSPNETTMNPNKTLGKHYSLAVQQLKSSKDLQDSHIPLVAPPPVSAYDEKEDSQYYRRIKVVQRRRKKFWESRPVKSEVPSSQFTAVKNNNTVRGTGSPENETSIHVQASVASIQGLSRGENDNAISRQDYMNNIDGIDPTAIDTNIFDQILEMDDDDEREFSRCMLMNALESNRRIVLDLEELM